jgi:hypothetical protein
MIVEDEDEEEEGQQQQRKKSAAEKALDKKDKEWGWKQKEINIPEYIYTQMPGPINCPSELTPLTSFLRLFPEVLCTHIITDTNHYTAHSEELRMMGAVMVCCGESQR